MKCEGDSSNGRDIPKKANNCGKQRKLGEILSAKDRALAVIWEARNHLLRICQREYGAIKSDIKGNARFETKEEGEKAMKKTILSPHILEDKCPECKSPLIEEQFDFHGEQLAVAVCTRCAFMDWVLPQKYLENEEDMSLFEESEKWSQLKAQEMRQKHRIAFIPIHYSENVKYLQSKEADAKLSELADSFGFKTIYIGKFSIGIRIEMK